MRKRLDELADGSDNTNEIASRKTPGPPAKQNDAEWMIRLLGVPSFCAKIVNNEQCDGDPEFQRRIEQLAKKSTEGSLTEAEQAEYEGYVRANKFIALLQRLARQMTTVSA